MKKFIIASLLSISFNFLISAQDEILVKECINNYLDGITKGDTSRLNKAFHGSAILRTVNASTGKIVDFPVRKFISSTPQGGLQAKPKIISYSLIGQSAVASIELSLTDFKYVDYLSLLKTGNDWKIVCRVFSRADLTMEPTTFNTGANPAGKKATKPKPKSDDGW